MAHLPDQPLSVEELHQVHLGSLDIIICVSYTLYRLFMANYGKLFFASCKACTQNICSGPHTTSSVPCLFIDIVSILRAVSVGGSVWHVFFPNIPGLIFEARFGNNDNSSLLRMRSFCRGLDQLSILGCNISVWKLLEPPWCLIYPTTIWKWMNFESSLSAPIYGVKLHNYNWCIHTIYDSPCPVRIETSTIFEQTSHRSWISLMPCRVLWRRSFSNGGLLLGRVRRVRARIKSHRCQLPHRWHLQWQPSQQMNEFLEWNIFQNQPKW